MEDKLDDIYYAEAVRSLEECFHNTRTALFRKRENDIEISKARKSYWKKLCILILVAFIIWLAGLFFNTSLFVCYLLVITLGVIWFFEAHHQFFILQMRESRIIDKLDTMTAKSSALLGWDMVSHLNDYATLSSESDIHYISILKNADFYDGDNFRFRENLKTQIDIDIVNLWRSQ